MWVDLKEESKKNKFDAENGLNQAVKKEQKRKIKEKIYIEYL